ncbi:hypothetical protein TWF569_006492 [Orbilia oligospora]|uniref:Vacuolar-sorting protein SNF8 n=1 Tax=Orbilia oligospora TaxID=2813651 RepID=A0A7C8J111_ORBOL|nr:hypothetical protein TWF102_001694 [Orbilia oligospora]KAF3092049.1 hypothetical protein TWF103_011349 [Orbilia oligospora]KAF3145943.1 hypothetical protein TWF569_006492 [Orbilia oligospora]KAF3152486.1 hypothetical protein TWF594_004171 [Orbilia oligospora]KAF3276296.1 hypothetical protein TWF970_006267 [Orbilia oligospora]
MRRRVGLAALDRRAQDSQTRSTHGATLRRTHQSELTTQLSVFQAALSTFSTQYSSEIRQNPKFRSEFARMCTTIGIDPLAASSNRPKEKGGSIWSELLGTQVNDFYFELAVKIVEVCRDTRSKNGGLISVSEVQSTLLKKDQSTGGGGTGLQISEDDIIRKTNMIRSVPKELNRDQAKVLEVIQVLGFVTIGVLVDNLGWIAPRAQAVVDDLMAEAYLWVDEQEGETSYWAPCSL